MHLPIDQWLYLLDEVTEIQRDSLAQKLIFILIPEYHRERMINSTLSEFLFSNGESLLF
jgi:hypothetical protein